MNINLETERLKLRLLEIEDAEAIERLAGDVDVAKTTLGIPHPYPKGEAIPYIQSRQEAVKNGKSFTFALISKADGMFMGTIGIHLEQDERAQLGYWIGKPYWGQGYMTEAAKRIVKFGFDELNLNRIYAGAMTKNPASYKVMEKLGMVREGTLRNHYKKWGQYEDIVYYGLLKSEYLSL